MTETTNPRAVSGDNAAVPDYAAEETARLKRDYPGLDGEVGDLLEEARGLPKEIADDAAAAETGRVIKRLRDLRKRIDGLREIEKTPWLRRGDACQGFFATLMVKLARDKKTDNAGAADVLQARFDDFTVRKENEEKERRALAAREAARIEREAIEKAERDRLAAEAARQAAERARKPETVEAKGAVAAAAEEAASASKVEAAVAESRAVDTHVATLARPADMVRSRHDDVLLTGKKEPYAILVDRSKVDMNALRPYFTEGEIEKALRGWAKATGHTQKMDGADIGHRTRGVAR